MEGNIVIQACGLPPITFPPEFGGIAAGFVDMAAKLISGETFLKLVAQIAPQTIDAAKTLVVACTGVIS